MHQYNSVHEIESEPRIEDLSQCHAISLFGHFLEFTAAHRVIERGCNLLCVRSSLHVLWIFPVSVSCLPQAESKEADAEADLAEAEAIKWRLMQSESTRFKACLSPAQSNFFTQSF